MIFSSMFGWVGIWAAWPFGWSCGAAVSVFLYRKAKWQSKK